MTAVSALAVLAACDIPTELPRFESRWVVPAEVTRFGVDDLLPGDVSLAPDSSAFLVSFEPDTIVRTLADLCSACIAADGFTVPKPPFLAAVDVTIELPPEVFAISVTDGQVLVEIENNFGFDPIRPGAGAFGSMTLQVTDDADGDVISELVIDGTDTSFPSGTTLTRTLMADPTELNGSLVATVTIDSPLGDPVMVDASAELSIAVTPSAIEVSSASIDVAGESVTFDPVDLGVEDIDQELEDRVVAGAFILDVVNPFGVVADFDLTVDGPGFASIQRSATITAQPTSSLRIEFSGDELRSFLGEVAVLSGGAVIDPGAGVITVLPGQELVLEASFDLTVEVGG